MCINTLHKGDDDDDDDDDNDNNIKYSQQETIEAFLVYKIASYDLLCKIPSWSTYINLGYKHVINNRCMKASLKHVFLLEPEGSWKPALLERLPPRQTYRISVSSYQAVRSNLLRRLIPW